LKVAANHPGTSAGARALLAAAAALFAQGNFAAAQTQFQKFSREFPDSPFRGQALLGVAASLDAQAKPDEAARAYKELIDRHPGDVVVPQAKFALARIYESQNRLKEARALYEDVSRTQSHSSLGNEASVKAEELRSKQPTPTPTPAAPPSFPILSTQPTAKTNRP
jgi:TolA-binding protein